jgi:phosphatidylserine/phosphatidylglycerophosphate/cardiolipin synthase-like enzyme
LADTPYPDVLNGSTAVEVMFSPDDGVAGRLIQLIRQAQHEVVLVAYAFTSQDLAQALEGAAAGGIRVRGVLEALQAVDPASVYSKLRQAGIEVLLDGNPANMHHKFMVIDGEIAISGS